MATSKQSSIKSTPNLWLPSGRDKGKSVNELNSDLQQANRDRADFIQAVQLHKGLQMLEDAQLPPNPTTLAALSLIRAHHTCLHAETPLETPPSLVQLDALPLPSELANRLTLIQPPLHRREDSNPLFQHATAMAYDHLLAALRHHLDHAFAPWFQSLRDVQDTVPKPTPRPQSDTTKRPSSAPAGFSSSSYRKHSISMLSGMKWRRYKKQASAHSPSTSMPSTPSAGRAFPSNGSNTRVDARPDVLARVFVHGIERFASLEQAQTSVIRYFDKASRQESSTALDDLQCYRLWVERNGWTFVPSNIKSGKGARLRSTLRSLTNFCGLDRPILSVSVDNSHYLVLLATGVVVSVLLTNDGVQVLDADINHQLCPFLSDHDVVVSACMHHQSLVVTTAQTCQVLVMPYQLTSHEPLRFKAPISSNVLPTSGASVVATSNMLLFTHPLPSPPSSPQSPATPVLQHAVTLARLHPSGLTIKLLHQMTLDAGLLWVQTHRHDPSTVYVLASNAEHLDNVTLMQVNIDLSKVNTMEHKVRGKVVTLVATDQSDTMLRVVKQATLTLPGLCTGFAVSNDQTEVYIHTTSPTMMKLPLDHLTSNDVWLITTQLPNVGYVTQHRHGWLAVVSLAGGLQLLDENWQPLRLGYSDDVAHSQNVLQLADYGIAGLEVAAVAWMETPSGAQSHQLLLTPVQGPPCVLQLHGLGKPANTLATCLSALQAQLDAAQFEAASRTIARLHDQQAWLFEAEALDTFVSHLMRLPFDPAHVTVLQRIFPSTSTDLTLTLGNEAYQQTVLQLRWRYFRHLLVHDALVLALTWCTDAGVPAMLTAYSEALRSRVGTAPELKVLLAIAQAAIAVLVQQSGSAEVSFV
eukprot:m.163775 g.163775  ORF g.163775 m.163775 type:complete len:865 (+) comp16561_c0_seq4:3-2597(+)